MTKDELHHALTLRRIPWKRIKAAGHNLRAIANEARQYGDEELRRKAKRAARPR